MASRTGRMIVASFFPVRYQPWIFLFEQQVDIVHVLQASAAFGGFVANQENESCPEKIFQRSVTTEQSEPTMMFIDHNA
jgi:hypothetical protein